MLDQLHVDDELDVMLGKLIELKGLDKLLDRDS